jgi:hypothetical protein
MGDAPDTALPARGLEVAAAVLARAFDAIALVDGDGALRLARALMALPPGRASVLPSRGLSAAWEAFGRAAAGEHVALVASGRDTVSTLVPLLREAARVGVGLTVVLPAHGDDAGRAVPRGPCDDVALALDQPVGVLAAGCVAEVAPVTLAALTLARATGRPWCVAFELARVGFAAAVVELPTEAACARWRPVSSVGTLDAGWAHIRALHPTLSPVAGVGSPEGSELSAGVGFGAQGIALRQLRPFPTEALAAVVRGPVRVREPWDDAWAPGRLTAAVRLALGPNVTVSVAPAIDDDAGCDVRVDLCIDEPRRDAVLREALGALAASGLAAEAACHEPWVATVRVRLAVRSPELLRGAICEPGALGLRAVLTQLASGTTVVAVGAGDLREADAVCERRGCTLRNDALAHLTPGAWPKP